MSSVVIPYRMREAFRAFHERTQQEAVLICHRRAGKTVAIANDAQKRTVLVKRRNPPPRIAWFYPTRVRAKDIAWGYLKHFSSTIPGVRHIESELSVEYPNGGRVTLYGADNARGVGLWLDGVYYDEADEIANKVVADVAPALADYSGFSVYAGMLRGRHNLWKRYNDALPKSDVFKMMLRASESNILDPVELLRLKGTMGESAYRMQMECDPNAAMMNAIYGEQMDTIRRSNRIGSVARDPSVPLYAFADIGHSLSGDDWAWWLAQFSERDILLLQYFSSTGKVPAFYAEKIREWEEMYGQKVAMAFLPHDGKQQNQLGKTTKDYLAEAGLTRVKIVERTPRIWDSINYLRALMARVHINQEGCGAQWTLGDTEMPSGIDCLDFYTKKEDISTGIITDVPVHNQYSHGADALRTMAEAHRKRMFEGLNPHMGEDGQPIRRRTILAGYNKTREEMLRTLPRARMM